MFCKHEDLISESDVEQKLVYPFLTNPFPAGLGYTSSEILTKPQLRRIEIGKGDGRKIYYPDYLVVMAGLPVLVIEAKKPGESLAIALAECRLYASELNAKYPSGINPCCRSIVCNGNEFWSAATDSELPDAKVHFGEISVASVNFARLVDLCSRGPMEAIASSLRATLKPEHWHRALNLVGGKATRAEELPPNTFGATIVGEFPHIFNPITKEDRALIAREAYIRSTARDRYVEPIDRIIRGAVPPASASLPAIADTHDPVELTAPFLAHLGRSRTAKTAGQQRVTNPTQRGTQKSVNHGFENQIMLLVGSVGSGKSTFVDYLTEVALPEDVARRSVWVRIDLNKAPITKDLAYSWMVDAIAVQLRELHPEMDFDDIHTIYKLYHHEINSFKKTLALLAPESNEYKVRLTDRIVQLQSDRLSTTRCMTRMLCGDTGKLLVVVLDNCDQRNRDEQLVMFQVAQWVRDQFRCFAILPVRDVTYDLYRHQPPLDTALKGLVFRIEPPPFVDVLQARVALALKEMRASQEETGGHLSYVLPNGMRVSYHVSEQSYYLLSILTSLFAHDRFVRQVMSGLAGRDVRRALEIFVDFCMSGHIGEDELYKIKMLEGQHVLPLSVLSRVILRMRRRYYDGNESYVKNLFQCYPDDTIPDHLVRIAVLRWLDNRRKQRGPSGATGFLRVGDLVVDLVTIGHERARVRSELEYLVRERCVIAEHLRLDTVEDDDLVAISSSGVVHLQLLINPDYIESCAEDTWVSDRALATAVAEQMTQRGVRGQFARRTVAHNAEMFASYIGRKQKEHLSRAGEFAAVNQESLHDVSNELRSAIEAARTDVGRRIYVQNIPYESGLGDVKKVFQDAGLTVIDVFILRDKNTERSRGAGFVTFAEPKMSFEALEREGEFNMGGRILRLGEAVEPVRHATKAKESEESGRAESTRVCILGIDFKLDETGLRSAIVERGFKVRDLHLVRDRATGKSRGIAFVGLFSVDEANRAIETLPLRPIGSRRVRVEPKREPRVVDNDEGEET